jgi:hypothetical protein
MTDEKLTKYYKWLTITACVCVITLTTAYLFWASSTNRPENPDSSNEEIQVVVKDSAETIKLQTLNKSLYEENKKLKLQLKNILTHVSPKLKQNEKNIYYAISHGDSVKMLISDSLLRAAGYK